MLLALWSAILVVGVMTQKAKDPQGKLPKNVILFLGDGMGIPIITAARIYKNQRAKHKNGNKRFFFESFNSVGIMKTHSYDYFVTDSAAGAMALFSGRKTPSDMIGMKPESFNKNCDGDNQKSIDDSVAELGILNGKAVGFVTTSRITHATPAALYAKNTYRKDEAHPDEHSKCQDIGSQLLQFPANRFKVMLGSGREHLYSEPKGKRKDRRNLLHLWGMLSGNRTVVKNKSEMDNVTPNDTDYLLGAFHGNFMEYEINKEKKKKMDEPGIVDMSVKAVEFMEHNNENGYFLLIEGGMIDIAAHSGKMHHLFGEVSAFDDAVKRVGFRILRDIGTPVTFTCIHIENYLKIVRNITNPDETLVIVTADHSHAFALSGYTKTNQDILDGSMLDESPETKNVKVAALNFVSGPGYEKVRTNKTKLHLDRKKYVAPAMVYQRYGSHGGEDVSIFADGPYAWLFSGAMENTEVAYTIKHLMDLNVFIRPENEPRLENDVKQPCDNNNETLVIILVMVIVIAIIAIMIVALLFLVLSKRKKVPVVISEKSEVDSRLSVISSRNLT